MFIDCDAPFSLIMAIVLFSSCLGSFVLLFCFFEFFCSQVDQQGHVRMWKFSEKCMWTSWGELNLCQSNSAEVVSVSWVRSTHQFVWCERRQSPLSSAASLSTLPSSQYCVCRRLLPAGECG